jgi:protein O-GlcNAc transferase
MPHMHYVAVIDYIQYIITDQVASPIYYESHYSEKFIWMPHSFLANSFPYQRPEMSLPPAKIEPHLSPQRNGCGKAAASFVYCNFNKQLKFNPTTFTHWLQVNMIYSYTPNGMAWRGPSY